MVTSYTVNKLCLSPLDEGDVNAGSRLQHDVGFEAWMPTHPALDFLERLQDPHNSVCHLSQRELLPYNVSVSSCLGYRHT